MRPEDLYDITSAVDPRLSPDGKTVAYAVVSIDKEESAYRSAIWLAAVDGSTPPRQLTAGKKADSTPRWSPDGTQLAFTSNRDGDHKQLYVTSLAGGDPTLPDGAEGGRRAARLVARRHADRLRVPRPRRRRTRRRTRRSACRDGSRATATSSTPSAGSVIAAPTSSSSRWTARPRRSSSRTATSRTTRRPGRPIPRRLPSRRPATRTGTSVSASSSGSSTRGR